MFKPHFGNCVCCNKIGIVVVKKGYIKECNERLKKEQKQAKLQKIIKKSDKKVQVKDLIKKLDEVFSLYIRHKYAVNGLVKCFTCSTIKPIKEIQNGHFESRRFYSLRWDEMNCRPCCVQCNVFKSGNYTEYSKRLTAEIGADKIELLSIKKHNKANLSTITLTCLIGEYKRKLLKYNVVI